MAKKKTRQQKILADQRHILYHLETTPAQVTLPREQKKTVELNLSPSNPHASASYAYVTHDIRKTAFITAGIIFAQIVLFFIIDRV